MVVGVMSNVDQQQRQDDSNLQASFTSNHDTSYLSYHSNVNNNNNENNSNENENDDGVTIDYLTMSLLISSVLYVFCLILAKRKLSILTRIRGSQLSTKKLLILSVALVATLRIMTFWGVAAMNIANVRAHYSLQPPETSSGHQFFYDRAMTVLFDLPNCMVVSTFLILALVFSECFVEARLHTESATNLKKSWLISFMVLNTCLYIVQLTLYGLIFLAPPTKVLRTIIYVGITFINFTAVLLVLIFYVYLNIRFSGFPYRSERLRSNLRRVSSVMSLWSLTRLIWGIATLYIFIYNIELLQDSDTPFWSFVVLLLLFVVCEILPIVALLDYSYLNTFGLERVEEFRISPAYDENETISSSVMAALSDPLFAAPATTTTANANTTTTTNSPTRSIRFEDELESNNDPLLPIRHGQG